MVVSVQSVVPSSGVPVRQGGVEEARHHVLHGADAVVVAPDRDDPTGPPQDAAGDQGLKFRRNFAEIRRKISFSLVTGKKNFGIFRKILFENSKFKKFRPKFAEIYRNFGTKFRFR